MSESGGCVAVIDDDQSVRESVVSLIESVGYEARAFSSAEELLNSSSIDQLSCLIVDVRLPGISGLQLYSRIKARRGRVRTIFVTAHRDEAARLWAMQTGAAGFLYKPFHAAALLSALRAATQKYAVESAAAGR